MRFLLPLALAAVLGACTQQPPVSAENSQKPASGIASAPTDNSRTSLDWAGLYRGTLPCASCPARRTELQLNANGTYRMKTLRQGTANVVMIDSGRFQWEASGGISLPDAGRRNKQIFFRIGENVLLPLDDARNPLLPGSEADARLVKQLATAPDTSLTESYWRQQ